MNYQNRNIATRQCRIITSKCIAQRIAYARPNGIISAAKLPLSHEPKRSTKSKSHATAAARHYGLRNHLAYWITSTIWISIPSFDSQHGWICHGRRSFANLDNKSSSMTIIASNAMSEWRRRRMANSSVGESHHYRLQCLAASLSVAITPSRAYFGHFIIIFARAITQRRDRPAFIIGWNASTVTISELANGVSFLRPRSFHSRDQ